MNVFRLFLIVTGIALSAWALQTGNNWQSAPLFLAISLVVLFLVFNRQGKWSILSVASIGLPAAFSAILWWLFPIPHLPEPAGPYPVGVRYATVETIREETFTDDPNDLRTLYVKIWYPAGSAEGLARNPYLEGGKNTVKTLVKNTGLPAFPFQHFNRIMTNAYTDAPIAEGRFALLTFSHGYGSWFGQNTPLMEELASQGFVVVSVGHSHQSLFAASDAHTLVKFPEVVPLQEEPADTSEEKLFDRFIQTQDTAEFNRLFYAHLNHSPSVNAFAVLWSEDISSVLDLVFRENRTSGTFLYDRIDTTRVGAFGMSFGGAASAEAALHDARIKAIINMDGSPYGTWIKDTLAVPVLFLEAPRSPYLYSMYAPLKYRTTSDYYCLMFPGTEHYNFTDVNWFSPVFRWMGLLGKVDGDFMIRSMNTIVPDFFTDILSGRSFQPENHIKPGSVLEPTY